jgi:hypothetical protein
MSHSSISYDLNETEIDILYLQEKYLYKGFNAIDQSSNVIILWNEKRQNKVNFSDWIFLKARRLCCWKTRRRWIFGCFQAYLEGVFPCCTKSFCTCFLVYLSKQFVFLSFHLKCFAKLHFCMHKVIQFLLSCCFVNCVNASKFGLNIFFHFHFYIG